MKVTDYIVSFFKEKGINHIFGYPGGVICHLIDSVAKADGIEAHIAYNEQGAAFAACGFAQSSNSLGVAFSTSGPGATNLVTGIANAFFDSIPTLFITGQVDTYASNQKTGLRQRGFQETDVVSMVKPLTKYAVRVDEASNIKYFLEKAFFEATNGNPGPVLLDLPADIQRSDIDVAALKGFTPKSKKGIQLAEIKQIIDILKQANRPVFLIGNGVKVSGSIERTVALIEKYIAPAVTSLPAFDVFPFNHPNYFGFIGTNGQRYANFVFGKADTIIALGSRLDIRQIGLDRAKFFKGKRLIRIDIDPLQIKNRIIDDEVDVCADLKEVLLELHKCSFNFTRWNNICTLIKEKLIGYDDEEYNRMYSVMSETLPKDALITLDVGQNQIWFAQSAHLSGQRVYMSAGHGSMGYSLPAAIGVYYGTHKDVYCFNGDGGLMMNIQELQFVKREALPIKIICFNNHALGMIRGFQERNFNKNYSLTTESTGWQSPDFEKIADAFGFPFFRYESLDEIKRTMSDLPKGPVFIEISYKGETNLIPNFGKTDLIQDQLPEIDRKLFDELMRL